MGTQPSTQDNLGLVPIEGVLTLDANGWAEYSMDAMEMDIEEIPDEPEEVLALTSSC